MQILCKINTSATNFLDKNTHLENENSTNIQQNLHKSLDKLQQIVREIL